MKSFFRKLRPKKKFTHHDPLPDTVRVAPDRHGLAIAVIAKDEKDDIAEWVLFHLLRGVRHIYIYDNGSTDGTLEITQKLSKHYPVTVTPWVNFVTQLDVQRLAYAHAITNFGADYRWIAFIDVDEFIFPKKHSSLTEALKELEHLPSVAMPWHMFGTSGHTKRPEGLVTENYTTRAPMPPSISAQKLLFYKTIADPSMVAQTGVHRPHLRQHGKVMYNDAGEQYPLDNIKDPARASANLIQLNHYYTKSEEDYEKKINRGRVANAGSPLSASADKKKRLIEQELVSDDSMSQFLDELKAELERFENLPA